MEYIQSAGTMLDIGWGAHSYSKTGTNEEQVPPRNPNDALLPVELVDETAKILP